MGRVGRKAATMILTAKEKSVLKKAEMLGRGNDTMLAHISLPEATRLKAWGGSGGTNEKTGLVEFQEIPESSWPEPGITEEVYGGGSEPSFLDMPELSSSPAQGGFDLSSMLDLGQVGIQMLQSYAEGAYQYDLAGKQKKILKEQRGVIESQIEEIPKTGALKRGILRSEEELGIKTLGGAVEGAQVMAKEKYETDISKTRGIAYSGEVERKTSSTLGRVLDKYNVQLERIKRDIGAQEASIEEWEQQQMGSAEAALASIESQIAVATEQQEKWYLGKNVRKAGKWLAKQT